MRRTSRKPLNLHHSGHWPQEDWCLGAHAARIRTGVLANKYHWLSANEGWLHAKAPTRWERGDAWKRKSERASSGSSLSTPCRHRASVAAKHCRRPVAHRAVNSADKLSYICSDRDSRREHGRGPGLTVRVPLCALGTAPAEGEARPRGSHRSGAKSPARVKVGGWTRQYR
eukprot:5019616-Pleurochrysis_carterae.AAC.4